MHQHRVSESNNLERLNGNNDKTGPSLSHCFQDYLNACSTKSLPHCFQDHSKACITKSATATTLIWLIDTIPFVITIISSMYLSNYDTIICWPRAPVTDDFKSACILANYRWQLNVAMTIKLIKIFTLALSLFQNGSHKSLWMKQKGDIKTVIRMLLDLMTRNNPLLSVTSRH